MIETKDSIRQQAMARRARMTGTARARAAIKIKKIFLSSMSIRPGSIIAGYWPIKSEPDIRPLLKELSKRGYRVALPVVIEMALPLAFRLWEDSVTPMRDGRFGISEPDPEAAPAVIPDVILVPMLAFDLKGHRLGYGAGFYDRTLAYLKAFNDPKAVGISYECQLFDSVLSDEYDRPMNMILTEECLRNFERMK